MVQLISGNSLHHAWSRLSNNKATLRRGARLLLGWVVNVRGQE